jgi:hypothetical protein
MLRRGQGTTIWTVLTFVAIILLWLGFQGIESLMHNFPSHISAFPAKNVTTTINGTVVRCENTHSVVIFGIGFGNDVVRCFNITGGNVVATLTATQASSLPLTSYKYCPFIDGGTYPVDDLFKDLRWLGCWSDVENAHFVLYNLLFILDSVMAVILLILGYKLLAAFMMIFVYVISRVIIPINAVVKDIQGWQKGDFSKILADIASYDKGAQARLKAYKETAAADAQLATTTAGKLAVMGGKAGYDVSKSAFQRATEKKTSGHVVVGDSPYPRDQPAYYTGGLPRDEDVRG